MICRSYPQNVMVQKVLSHRQLLQWSYVLPVVCEYHGKCAAVLDYQWDFMVHWLYLLSTSFLDLFFYHRCLSLRIPGISKSKNQPWLTHLVRPSIMGMVPKAVWNIMITIKSLFNGSILQVLTCCAIIVFLTLLTTHMKPSHTNLAALKGLECSTSTTSLPGLLV